MVQIFQLVSLSWLLIQIQLEFFDLWIKQLFNSSSQRRQFDARTTSESSNLNLTVGPPWTVAAETRIATLPQMFALQSFGVSVSTR